MTPDQIAYYEALPEEQKQILIHAALKAVASPEDVLAIWSQLKGTSRNKVEACMEEARKKGLLMKHYMFRDEYDVSIPFMIYLYPSLGDHARLFNIVRVSRKRAVQTWDLYLIRNFLYTLLFSPDLYPSYENEIVGSYGWRSELAVIVDTPAYEPHLTKIRPQILQSWFKTRVETYPTELRPLSEIRALCNKMDALLPASFGDKVSNSFKGYADLQSAQFTSLAGAFYSSMELQGFAKLIEGDVPGSIASFNESIERTGLTDLLPESNSPLLFYFVALLRADPDQSMPIIRKIIAALKKNKRGLDKIPYAVLWNAVKDEKNKTTSLKSLTSSYASCKDKSTLLWYTCIYYLADALPEVIPPNLEKIIRQGIDSGYYLLSLEAAFVYNSWIGPDADKLLAFAQKQVNYTPVLAGIKRRPDWENSLDTMLETLTGRPVLPGQQMDENKTARIVYFVNFEKLLVRPVLQTRGKKGWLKGRALPLKTFNNGDVEGMTDQDRRIANTIKLSGYSSYSCDYSFNKDVFVELVGCPNIFLEDSEVSVDLILGRPIVQVQAEKKGYRLSTNLNEINDKIIVEKETNTRYRVYNLSETQFQLLRTIKCLRRPIPKEGKDKLMKLLGSFGSHVEVHSDLLADTGVQTQIKEVDPDNCIRVQLLPMGAGLKAELFCKPFGTHPPYCKPGKGGAVLIASERGEQVKRDLMQETEYANALMDDIQSLESLSIKNDLMSFDNPIDSLFLLDILAAHQDKCIVEWPEGVQYKIRGTANFNNLNLNLKSGTNWFELQGELKVDEHTVLTLQQLLNLTENSHDRFIELSKGEFLALSSELKKQLDELRTFATQSKSGVQLNKFASVSMDDFFGQVENMKVDKAWKDFRMRLDKVKGVEAKIPKGLQADLRPYQEEGFRWMARLAEWDGGACLADDMGLGKTIQTLAILLHRAYLGPALVVCPVSVLGNWLKEAERFAPSLNMKTLSLGHASREQTMQSLEAGDVLVTSYGLLQSEEQLFSEQEFATVVLDEAHTIKNYATKTSKSTMQLKASFRLALTGTPLQNHLGEIWNLFNFVNPGLLGTLPHFTDTFIKPSDEGARKRLKKLITPFILRRTKSAVLDELPLKTEIIKKVSMSAEEMAFYEALRRQALQNITAADSTAGNKQLQVMAEITKLRQASCNPLLVDPNISIPSSKLQTFLEIVDDLIDNKHRVLVFSQFVTHLSIVRHALDKKGIKYQYLDGSMSIPQREKSVKKFQQGEGDLFLISLKAGGLGLNLTAADYVIHMDPWWNPAIEDQASDRAHRIGQTRPVTIYRLVAENTIEEKIIQLHNTKRDLAESLLEGSDQSARLSINELINLIKTN